VSDAQVIIPTLSKSKISHLLSYPTGAERISKALASVPQLSQLKLHFIAAMADGLRDVRIDGKQGYEFLRVEYLDQAAPDYEYPIRHFWPPRPLQYQWEIVVQPVPRQDRHKVKTYIAEAALPKVSGWLTERSNLSNRGAAILAFFYENETETFLVRNVDQLEPLR
jgi:hypothetical protein